MNYQGSISESGVALSGSHTITFSIYSAPASGSLIWGPQVFDGELAVGDGHRPPVEFVNGRFNVKLGPEDTAGRLLGDRLTDAGIGGERWIQIRVGTSDPMPRQQLLTAPFAFVSEVARQVEPHDERLEVDGVVESTQGFRGFGIVPVGAIVAWHKNLPGVPALPDGWVECNGQVLNDEASVLHGQQIPNLNGEKRFLRGGSSSGTGQSDAMQDHKHQDPGHSHTSASFSARGYPDGSGDRTSNYYFMHPSRGTEYSLSINTSSANLGGPTAHGVGGTPRVSDETRPVNMSVVWIMRVK